MSNPWDAIARRAEKTAFDWLYCETELRESASCPFCGSTNVTEVWIDGLTSTYLCNICNNEFLAENNGDRGVIVDIPIIGAAYASIYHSVSEGSRRRWFVEFNVADERIWEVSFNDEIAAQLYIADVKRFSEKIIPGTALLSQQSQLVVDALDGDYICFLDNTKAFIVRAAIGIQEGYFLLDN